MSTPSPATKNIFFDWLWRIPLGSVFIYAAWSKIIDPESFAQMIDNYRLFPAWSHGPLAIVLPWLEIWAGLLVILGVWKREAAFILGVLLVSFILAVGYNLYRGLDFQCGCFGGSSGGRQAGFNLLWQDGLLMICAIGLVLGIPKQSPQKVVSSEDESDAITS